jgi:hypothetical protein
MQADPKPPPEVPIFPTYTSRLLRPVAKAFRISSLATDMSIPATSAPPFLLKPGLSPLPGPKLAVVVR